MASFPGLVAFRLYVSASTCRRRTSGRVRSTSTPFPMVVAISDGALCEELLLLAKPNEVAYLIEHNYERMGVATGSVALHMLARSSALLTADERKALASQDWFGKMMMRLGSQLSGAREADAQGLICILWALAALEQVQNPMLLGLVKRLLLLAQHGRVSVPQLLLTAQALARLKMLGGPIGIAMCNLVQVTTALASAAPAQVT